MFFNLGGPYSNINLVKTNVLYLARNRLLFYKFNVNEIALDKYLRQEYKKPLRKLCLGLLKKGTFQTDTSGNLQLVFLNSKDDRLASLITYGNEKIQGSKILTIALFRAKKGK